MAFVRNSTIWSLFVLFTAVSQLPQEATAGNLCPGPVCPITVSRAGSTGWGSIHETYQRHLRQSNSDIFASLADIVATNIAVTNATLNAYEDGRATRSESVVIDADLVIEDRADMRAHHRRYYKLVKRMEDLQLAYSQFPRQMRTHYYGNGDRDDWRERADILETYTSHFARMRRFTNRPIGELIALEDLKKEVWLSARVFSGPPERWAMKHTLLLEELQEALRIAPAIPSPDGITEKLQDRVWVEERRLAIFKIDRRKGKLGYKSTLDKVDVKFAKVKPALNVTTNRLKARRPQPQNLATAGRFDSYYYTPRYKRNTQSKSAKKQGNLEDHENWGDAVLELESEDSTRPQGQ